MNHVNKKQARDHQRTTAMLIAVVLSFVVAELPQGILVVICSLNNWYFDNVYAYLGDLLDIVVLLNSSVNFVLYVSMSQMFRDTFRAKLINPLLKAVKHKKRKESSAPSEQQKLTEKGEENETRGKRGTVHYIQCVSRYKNDVDLSSTSNLLQLIKCDNYACINFMHKYIHCRVTHALCINITCSTPSTDKYGCMCMFP